MLEHNKINLAAKRSLKPRGEQPERALSVESRENEQQKKSQSRNKIPVMRAPEPRLDVPQSVTRESSLEPYMRPTSDVYENVCVFKDRKRLALQRTSSVDSLAKSVIKRSESLRSLD